MMINDYDYDDIDDDHDDFGGAGGVTKRRSLPMGSSWYLLLYNDTEFGHSFSMQAQNVCQ